MFFPFVQKAKGVAAAKRVLIEVSCCEINTYLGKEQTRDDLNWPREYFRTDAFVPSDSRENSN